MLEVYKQGDESIINCMISVKISIKTKQFVREATPFIEIIKNPDQNVKDPYLILNKQNAKELINILVSKLNELEKDYAS